MNKLFAISLFVIASISSSCALAEYLPGQTIQRPASFSRHLSDAFFPGFTRQADGAYINAFTASDRRSYVFEDEFSDSDREANDREATKAPVGNLFNFSF